MKNIKLIFILLLFMGVFSCKKKGEDETYVKGNVYNLASQTYVANYHVVLKERYLSQSSLLHIGGTNSGSYQYAIMKEGYTDTNGNYDLGMFEAKRDKKYDYFLNEGILNKGEHNTTSFETSGAADLTINFLPPPPYNAGDSLVVRFVHSIYPTNKYIIKDTNYYTYFQPRGVLNGRYYINIDKFKSGIYSNIKDTVFYPDGSINQYNVNW